MAARNCSVKGARMQPLRERVMVLAPWTDPEVLLINGCHVLQVRVSHLLSVTATNASGHWQLQAHRALGGDQEAGLGTAQDLEVPWDGEVSLVAHSLIATCAAEWNRTLTSSESSSVMKAKAAEKLDALRLMTTPGVMVETPNI